MTDKRTSLEGLRVFVSYPRGGLAHTWAEDVQTHLESLGAEVFRDEYSIPEGDQNWYGRIEQALERAQALVAVVGQDSKVCVWQQRELVRADVRGIPIVPLRIDQVESPLCIAEKQPVEARRDRDRVETLSTLAAALGRECADSGDGTAGGERSQYRSEETRSAWRRHEIDYLNALIHCNYSDREKLYVPLRGIERRELLWARAMKNEQMDTDAVLKAFRMDGEAAERIEEKTYSDVLQAYRDLPQRPVRRLAVLGEPGAGKSFSLQRIAVEYAHKALADAKAPLPLLLALGLWTRDSESLGDFIERQLDDLGRHFHSLRDERRAVLLLDGLNEIPPGQRESKTAQIRRLANDERFASVVVSCREKDFKSDFRLPFDTLVLQPWRPSQIREYLHRVMRLSFECETDAENEAEERFWQIAGGPAVREVWEVWRTAGVVDIDVFWAAEKISWRDGDVCVSMSEHQEKVWRRGRFDRRGLIRLAANPYLLRIMTVLPSIPNNRAQLLEGFLKVLYGRELEARKARHDAARVPNPDVWRAALAATAETLQRRASAEVSGGAQTALPQNELPDSVTPAFIDFSIDASVLHRIGGRVRFSHQLLQEFLASRALLAESMAPEGSAAKFWPAVTWWQRTGWEVVAEIAAESLGDDLDAQTRFIAWLAETNPEVAASAWEVVGRPPMPIEVEQQSLDRWLALMTDPEREPHPPARAALGRALWHFGLDRRPGVALRNDGLPDIAWIKIRGGRFSYHFHDTRELDTFWIGKFPVTNAQYQSFIDDGAYADTRWWCDLKKPKPHDSVWPEGNRPRTNVDWYEAVAFTRWLTVRLGLPEGTIRLPTEVEWEKAARGTDGRIYPWGKEYLSGYANVDEKAAERREDRGPWSLQQTTAVGLYPHGSSPYGVQDLSGTVYEWCVNKYFEPEVTGIDRSGDARAMRGGCCTYPPIMAIALGRYGAHPSREGLVGFRVASSLPMPVG